MLLLRRLRLVALFSAIALARAALPAPSDWILPPVEGELAGEFDAIFLGGAPKLKWKLKLGRENPRERIVGFAVDGYGLRLRGEARLDPIGEGPWRIEEAEVNLGEWAGWLVPKVAADYSTVTMAGTVRVSGEGTWRGGVLGGKASIRLRDGRLEDAGRKVLFEGIAFDVQVEDLAARRTAPAQVVTWKSGLYDVVPLGAGRVEFAVNGDQVNVARAAITVFGGELAVRDLAFSTERPEFAATAQITNVDISQLLFLLPPVLSEARGRLRGQLSLRRNANGIVIGAGELRLPEGETAQLRLKSSGVIASSLPPKINQLYPGLLKMERGEIPLSAEVLELKFMPLPDELGRTAWVHLAGRPADRAFTGPMDLTINVRGPLDQLVNLGATSALKLFGGN